jgi:hypothetical protein
MNFGVRRHVAAFKARTCPRIPNLCDVDLSCPSYAMRSKSASPLQKGKRIEVRGLGTSASSDANLTLPSPLRRERRGESQIADIAQR